MNLTDLPEGLLNACLVIEKVGTGLVQVTNLEVDRLLGARHNSVMTKRQRQVHLATQIKPQYLLICIFSMELTHDSFSGG